MKRLVLLGLLILLAGSCKNDSELFNEFEIELLEGIRFYPEGLFNPSSHRFIYFQNSIFWIDYQQDEFLFSLPAQPEQLNNIYSHDIKRGRGPGEFMMPLSPFRKDKYISFFDSHTGSLYMYNQDTLYNDLRLSEYNPYTILQMAKLENNKYLFSGALNDSRFELIDSNQQMLSSYGVFPGKLDDLLHEMWEKNLGCVNFMVARNNSFANIIYDSGIIEFFEVKNDTIIKINEFIYSDYEYSIIRKDGATLASRSKNNTGFVDICSDDDNVFALYSTVTWKENPDMAYFGDYILIYTWEGIPLKALKLDIPLRGFSKVPGTNELWGLGHDLEGVYIVKYKYSM